MNDNKRVSDHFEDEEEFELLLNNADSQASSDWEMGFCSDMKVRYDQFGAEMFLTDKQLETLKRIAKEDE